ncbi:hypothetical protein [Burkholderia glumae]|uniref:hypothetical protein n=1 Tax=Burkholderia glumae TaxID=337 RepID=UPI0020371DE9|nr:hypothetical protein [Burkholderia glumae]
MTGSAREREQAARHHDREDRDLAEAGGQAAAREPAIGQADRHQAKRIGGEVQADGTQVEAEFGAHERHGRAEHALLYAVQAEHQIEHPRAAGIEAGGRRAAGLGGNGIGHVGAGWSWRGRRRAAHAAAARADRAAPVRA